MPLMRWVVDPDLEGDIARAAYRTTLAWAAGCTDRFVLLFEPSREHDPAVFSGLCRLGRSVKPTLVRPPGLIASLFFGAYRVEQVQGVPSPALVEILTSHTPPAEAAGDLCPTSMLGLFRGARRLYWCGDFGRDQRLELEPAEHAALCRVLAAGGISQTCLRAEGAG
jgi:hypothetical protein